MKAMEPLKMVKYTTRNACLWLDHSPMSERPLWKVMWNSAGMKCATERASDYITARSELMKPDIICEDFTKRENGILARRFSKTSHHENEKKVHTKSQVLSALEIILESMKRDSEEEFDRIVVLGGITGRFDHTMATLQALLKMCKKGVDVYACDGENLVMVLPEGTNEIEVDKRYLTGKCGIAPICQRGTTVTTDGFKWDLDDKEISYDSVISTSNMLNSKIAYIKCDTPVVFTMELNHETQCGMVKSKL